MDKLKLRVRHNKVILKKGLINFLGKLHVKDFLRKRMEMNVPAFGDTVEIDSTKKNIFVLPNMPWTYRMQRPQQIFSRLAKRYNIFYISPITSNTEYFCKITDGIYEAHLQTKVVGNVLRDFHLNTENLDSFVESFDRLLGEYTRKKGSLLFVLHPVWKDVAFRIDGVRRVYDMMDLYAGFSEAKKEIVVGEESLIKHSDVVITTAQNLFDHAKKLNKKSYLVRNGCDYDMFSKLKKNGELDCLKNKPIIGYYGALNDWLDVKTLEEVVKGNRDKYFVFIGAINTDILKPLYRYHNVYFLGEVAHKELPGYLAYFDVCTIPFVLNDLILNTNPVKFYEYICSGRPVIAPQLPELKQYSDICYLYNNVEKFNGYINEALKEKKELKEKRRKIGMENSWNSRVDEIVKIIR